MQSASKCQVGYAEIPVVSRYSEQTRGDSNAYERYLRGMDASMRQKVAITAAHLLCQGRVADMGMGSGSGSYALACLYPRLSVIGVDVDPKMVSRAAERFEAPNLNFEMGDIAESTFEPSSLDGIFNSSVLHHVTSFNDYDRTAAARALKSHVAQLRTNGVLIVRDFVDPGPGDVWLDVPADDGSDDTGDPSASSTAALFERFSREFRSLSDKPGFKYTEIKESLAPPLSDGWRRFRLTRTLATEFILRKDYREHWPAEVKEEYTYMTQSEFEETFARLGLRLLASIPIWNPWIVRNRYVGKFALHDLEGRPLEPPATNYIIVGEKVPRSQGVRFFERRSSEEPSFLEMEYYRHKGTGRVLDLTRRPNKTLDVVPWFIQGGATFVLARTSYPRPILSSTDVDPPIDGSTPAQYLTAPLYVFQEDRPVGQTVEEALEKDASISPEAVKSFAKGTLYYPSPGGVQEEVRSVFVEIEPVFMEADIDGRSGFSTSGHVRAIDAEQVLRAGQVGALPDARLELNVYDLLKRIGQTPGPWIGDTVELKGDFQRRAVRCEDLVARTSRRQFQRATATESSEFLQLRSSSFAELSSNGELVAEQSLEWVVPRNLSRITASCALLARRNGEVWIGLHDDDLPAAQSFEGNSQLLVTPAWRLPRSVASTRGAREFLCDRLREEYGVTCGELWRLGGKYYPSPGVTPEVVHPFATEVLETSEARFPILWVRLVELCEHVELLRDGHLRVAAFRAAHALGVLWR